MTLIVKTVLTVQRTAKETDERGNAMPVGCYAMPVNSYNGNSGVVGFIHLQWIIFVELLPKPSSISPRRGLPFRVDSVRWCCGVNGWLDQGKQHPCADTY